jgi:hypothetical protein
LIGGENGFDVQRVDAEPGQVDEMVCENKVDLFSREIQLILAVLRVFLENTLGLFEARFAVPL